MKAYRLGNDVPNHDFFMLACTLGATLALAWTASYSSSQSALHRPSRVSLVELGRRAASLQAGDVHIQLAIENNVGCRHGQGAQILKGHNSIDDQREPWLDHRSA